MLPTQFSYESKQLRMFIKNGELYFCAADVCNILEISNPTDAIKRLEEDELDLIEVTDSLGRQQITNGVNNLASIRSLFSKIYSALKRQFGVLSYWDLKRSDFSKAFRFFES
ncbi:BRO family protein [Desulfosporosinus sp. SYSU MS00001]|uniref:BRO family protein n=1 Tax=Desulfosporosinus sp. SYSU MS00001 TaxID=3416284 RepID=UPI003CF71B19